MTDTKEHPNLASALVAALGKLSVVEAGQTADTGSYKYHYASIADVVQVTRPVLAEHGLVALTPVKEHNDGLECTVVLLHESGQSMEFGPFPFPHGRDAQATGSMVTYHRRYALLSALGMGVGDDDDGAKAVQGERPAQATQQGRQELTNRLASLPQERLEQVTAWWKEQGLPLMASGKPNSLRLTAEQQAVVVEFLDGLESAVGSGDSGRGGGGPEQATAGSDGSKTGTGLDSGVPAPSAPSDDPEVERASDPVPSVSSEGSEAGASEPPVPIADAAPSGAPSDDDLPQELLDMPEKGPAGARKSLEKAQPARRRG